MQFARSMSMKAYIGLRRNRDLCGMQEGEVTNILMLNKLYDRLTAYQGLCMITLITAACSMMRLLGVRHHVVTISGLGESIGRSSLLNDWR